MKKYVALLLALSLALGILPVSLAEDAGFVEREVPVILEDGGTDAIAVRFYPDQPNVPYIGLKAYSEYVGSNPLSCEKGADGTLVFTGAQGVKAVADPVAGTLSTDDWSGFRYPALPYEGKGVALKDSDCAFVRITDVIYEGDPRPTTLDFGRYGLRMYPGDDDVYLSLTLVSSLMCDMITRVMGWNGERARYGMFVSELFAEPDMESAMMQALMTEGTRPADVAEETYAELCFAFDNFFGHPGVAALDAAIAEKGLEQAVLDLGETGRRIVEGLKSTQGYDYLSAVNDLFMLYLYDGHTVNSDANYLLSEWTLQEVEAYDADTLESALMPLVSDIIATEQINETRDGIWGGDTYRERGNTAIIRIDSFMPDEAGWAAYYRGEGELPQDEAGVVVAGLRKAAENPDIRNVIFDLSINQGGASDVLAFIAALATGADRLYGIEKLTGRRMTVVYEADTNLDGAFDARDREAACDQFRYGVLASRASFSAGNMFPFLMQERGAVLLGEPTGGGSCCVQLVVLPDGTSFYMSGDMWQVTDENFESVEGGCRTDIPIDYEVTSVTEEGVEWPVFDYSGWFDDEMLDRVMNEWFEQAEAEGMPDAA